MRVLTRTFAAAALGLAALGAGPAFADDDDRGRYDRYGYHDDYDDDDDDGRWGRPPHCDHDHDHRIHHVNYYDYYEKDRYYHADPRGLSLSVTIGGDRRGYYDRGRHYDRGGYYDRYRYYDRPNRVVRHETFDTRYRARVVLVEEIDYGRYGRRLICTVSARGPDADYVRGRRLERIAHRYCSPHARIRVYS